MRNIKKKRIQKELAESKKKSKELETKLNSIYYQEEKEKQPQLFAANSLQLEQSSVLLLTNGSDDTSTMTYNIGDIVAYYFPELTQNAVVGKIKSIEENLYLVIEAKVKAKKDREERREKYLFDEKDEAISISKKSVICVIILNKCGTINLKGPNLSVLESLKLIKF